MNMAKTPQLRTLDQVIAGLPEKERVRIDARARELIAEQMSLQRLRKTIGKTQTAVAKRLKVGQDAVSKIETRGDMHVSTLRDFINAMGGELELIAQFPNRPPVRLKALGTASLRRNGMQPPRPEKSMPSKSAPKRASATRD